MKLVKDYMTQEVITLNEKDNLLKAVKLLEDGRFRHLPVINDFNEIVGIVSDRDLRNIESAMAIVQESIEIQKSEISIVDIMTDRVLTIDKEAPLKDAAGLMIDNKYGALPVIDNEKICGIISYTDILRAFIDLESSL